MRANIGTLQSLHTGAGYSSERTSKNAFTLHTPKITLILRYRTRLADPISNDGRNEGRRSRLPSSQHGDRAQASLLGDRLPREHHPSYASVVALQVLMFRACEPMRMMHMFVCCHVYLEYHLNISKFSGRADRTCATRSAICSTPLSGQDFARCPARDQELVHVRVEQILAQGEGTFVVSLKEVVAEGAR